MQPVTRLLLLLSPFGHAAGCRVLQPSTCMLLRILSATAANLASRLWRPCYCRVLPRRCNLLLVVQPAGRGRTPGCHFPLLSVYFTLDAMPLLLVSSARLQNLWLTPGPRPAKPIGFGLYRPAKPFATGTPAHLTVHGQGTSSHAPASEPAALPDPVSHPAAPALQQCLLLCMCIRMRLRAQHLACLLVTCLLPVCVGWHVALQ